MQKTTVKSLGFNVTIEVPSSVEEFDLNAKKSGACLEQAIANILYRGVLADVRYAVCEAVEKKYEIERKTKDSGRTRTVKAVVDGKEVETKEPVLVFAESEADYIDRVIAAKGIKREDLQPIVDSVLAAKDGDGNLLIKFDASAPEKKASAPKKLAQKFADAAKALIDQGKVDAFNKNLAKFKIDTFTASGNAEADITSLGWKVKALLEAKEAQALAQLTS